MIPPARIVVATLALACLAPLAAPTVVGDTSTPLTLEDVVRRFVSGTAATEIVEWIRSSDVDFDLNDEMLDELSLAGIPDEVIRAMQTRQLVLHPPPEPATEDGAEAGAEAAPTLTVRLNPSDDSKADVRLLNSVPTSMADTLRLRDADSRITDLAVFLLCATADHVPDHWRSKTPLGRDFVLVPRHKLLVFHPGATPGEESETVIADGQEVRLSELILELPDTLEVQLEPSVPHDLVLGLAVQIEERYYLWAGDDWLGFELDGDRTIGGRILGSGDPSEPSINFWSRNRVCYQWR